MGSVRGGRAPDPPNEEVSNFRSIGGSSRGSVPSAPRSPPTLDSRSATIPDGSRGRGSSRGGQDYDWISSPARCPHGTARTRLPRHHGRGRDRDRKVACMSANDPYCGYRIGVGDFLARRRSAGMELQMVLMVIWSYVPIARCPVGRSRDEKPRSEGSCLSPSYGVGDGFYSPIVLGISRVPYGVEYLCVSRMRSTPSISLM